MPTPTPIAIVGVSALFPGSQNARGFWRDILAGTDLLEEVPPSHWLLEDYYDPNDGEDMTYARRGAFLEGVDFAPMDYGIPPNILAATDTGQLLAMIVAKHLLDDAFDGPFEKMDRSRTGAVLGVASTTELCLHMAGRLQKPVWEEGMRRSGLTHDEIEAISEKIAEMFVPWEENTFPGLLGNVVSGRIANRFDLGGTNCVIDAACASSLAALEMGINQLALGQADMMITGGIDALNDILMYMCFSKTGALSKTGDCRPFSNRADGTMMAEGLGMFALKRLDDAERDGNKIYAVIKGVGSSSDGRAKSIYAPRPEGQAKALERAYDDAGYSPETVELVEAHGTATPAGDAAETRGLKSVFGNVEDPDERWCALGSVKSQIGHAKAAAGAAGLFKVVGALQHKTLPPTIKIDEPNPDLELDESPFYLNTEPRPWIRGSDHPRRNAVSAFGFGGTNFHVTLEEYTGSGKQAPRLRTLDTELVLLSSDDPTPLVDKCRQLAGELDADDLLPYLAKTTQQDFDADKPARLAIVAASEKDLAKKLERAADTIDAAPENTFSSPDGIHYGFDVDAGDVAFLFPGQGSQYLNMGAQWAMHFEDARQIWDRAADLDLDDGRALHEVVFPKPVFTEEDREEQKERLTATEWAQPALGATSLSVLSILGDMGLEPTCAAGHSYGEITALAAAGVLDTESMLRVSRKRGELMADASDIAGTMSAVRARADDLQTLLDEWGSDVVIANHNSPTQCVLSGATDAIEEVEEKLNAEKIPYTRLSVSTAFHSSLVSDSEQPFLDFLENVDFGEATFDVYANSLADVYPEDTDEMRKTLAGQLARPVRFVEQIDAMYDAGVRTFVEVGPHSTLTRLVGKCLSDRPHHAVHVDRRGVCGIKSLFGAIGYLATRGVELNFEPLWRDYEEVTDPRDVDEAAFTVKIKGTNYDKPYPADDPRPEPQPRPKPPELIEEIKREFPEPTPVTKPEASTTMTNHNHDHSNTPPETDGNRQSPPANCNPQPRHQTHAGPQHSGPTWVDAFREQQRQTAEAHKTFQETTAEAHRAFLETMNTSFQALGHLATGEQPTLPATGGGASRAVQREAEGAPVQQSPAPQTLPARGEVAASAVHERSEGAPAQPITPAYTNGHAPQSQRVETTRNVASPHGAGRSATVDVLPILLETVADKTGYPQEMLEPEMALESDLGVDSIKQVEIMSQMEEEIPELPEVDANELAERCTLQEIADFLQSALPAATPSSSEQHSTPLPRGGGAERAVQREAEGAAINQQPTKTKTSRSGSEVGDRRSKSKESGRSATPDVLPILLETVADKTGYPQEMLEPEMELEADLGVDSIKQVEIMSQMEERLPNLPEVEANELAELRTLHEIAAHLESLLGGRAPRSQASGERGVEEDADDDSESDQRPAGIERYAVRPTDTPACGWAMPGLTDETIYVVSTGSDVADALADELNERGATAEVIESLPEGARSAIFVDSLGPVESLEEATAINRRAIMCARDLVAESEESPKLFVTVQDTGGRFCTSDGDVRRAWTAGVGALTKTAAAEWPDASCKAIDLATDDLDATAQAQAIADELFFGGPELEVGIDANGTRTTPVALTEPIERTDDALDILEEDDVVVVSGGAKGVTARSIIELARELPLRFVLLGRTKLTEEPAATRGAETDAELNRALLSEAKRSGESLTPKQLRSEAKHIRSCREIRDTLHKLDEAGAQARYASADVRDTERIREVLDEVRTEWGPVRGLIHGAGVLADALIKDKTEDQFDFVFKTKIEGLKALLDASCGSAGSLPAKPLPATGGGAERSEAEGALDELSLLCLFSSVAARSGNPGQSDYAMANEVLNKIAHAEAARRPNCRVKSLGWGPWDGGMVTPTLKAHFEAEGVVLLPRDVGAEMLVDEVLYAPDDVELVLGGSVSAEGMNGSRLTDGIESTIIVTPETMPYLDSHRLRDIPVVPAMLVVEWFTRFAQNCCPDLELRKLTKIEVRNGIKVENFDDGGTTLTIRAELHPDSEKNEHPVLDLKVLDATGDMVHYAARAEMAPSRQKPDSSLLDEYDLDLPKSPWTVDEVYTEGKLFHGEDFEVLTELKGLGKEGGIAHLDGLERMDWPAEAWTADPAAMDGALQVSLLWGLDLIGHQTLPMRAAGFTPFVANPSNEPLVCYVRRVKHNRRQIVADVLIATEGGEPLCELHSVEMFAVPDGV